MRSNIRSTSTLSLLAVVLAACNGGGGGSNGSTTPTVTVQSPPPKALASSKGDMSNYVGSWISDCGMVVMQGAVKAAVNRYTFSSPAQAGVDSVQGELRQTQFTDTLCTKVYGDSDIAPVRQSFTVTFYGTVDLAKQTSTSKDFTGTADQLRYDPAAGSSVTSSKVAYVAFSDNGTKMRFEYGLPFSSLDLVYTKTK